MINFSGIRLVPNGPPEDTVARKWPSAPASPDRFTVIDSTSFNNDFADGEPLQPSRPVPSRRLRRADHRTMSPSRSPRNRGISKVHDLAFFHTLRLLLSGPGGVARGSGVPHPHRVEPHSHQVPHGADPVADK